MVKKILKERFGFTLVELMIVVAIIAILAAIAIPNFIRFQMKARQSEARILLAGVHEAEIIFFSENDYFSTDFNQIGFIPTSNPKYYKNWYLNISADRFHFTATCSADIDADGLYDSWIVTDRHREPWNVFNDITNYHYPYPY